MIFSFLLSLFRSFFFFFFRRSNVRTFQEHIVSSRKRISQLLTCFTCPLLYIHTDSRRGIMYTKMPPQLLSITLILVTLQLVYQPAVAVPLHAAGNHSCAKRNRNQWVRYGIYEYAHCSTSGCKRYKRGKERKRS